ncbi:MAG: hypothetical protein R3268_11695 [Acidiferrobacterales bacterium]|nr:hypothetical protein [Acidiferrobacterales bacterium]
MAELVCWNCGDSLKTEPLPLSRRAVCAACNAELHVCRLCQFYDPRVSEQCTEDRADQVREKDRANFCDYFKPKHAAYVARQDTKSVAAKAALDGLFGEGIEDDVRGAHSEKARTLLDKLFEPGDKGNK